MFQGLLDVHAVLHNPFGNRENDIPHESLCAGLRKLAEGLRDTADACTLNFDGTWNRGGPPLPPLSAVGAAGARGAASGRVPAVPGACAEEIAARCGAPPRLDGDLTVRAS